jgi:hypothetical protein
MADQSPNRNKNRWIQIGKQRHRIREDHDDYLDEVIDLFRYDTKEEALFATSYYGSILMALFGFVPLKNVRFRALSKGRPTERSRSTPQNGGAAGG